MRLLLLVLSIVAIAGPALAENPSESSGVTILRGSSAPPPPPPPPPIIIELPPLEALSAYANYDYAWLYFGYPAYYYFPAARPAFRPQPGATPIQNRQVPLNTLNTGGFSFRPLK